MPSLSLLSVNSVKVK